MLLVKLDLDDINNYQINIVFAARKLAEALLDVIDEYKKLDDINNYQINIVLLVRKITEVLPNIIRLTKFG